MQKLGKTNNGKTGTQIKEKLRNTDNEEAGNTDNGKDGGHR